MTAAKRAEIVGWLEATRLRQRSYPFRFVTTQMKAVGFPTANGWPNLMIKAKGLSLTDPEADWDAYVSTSRAVYRNARLFGSSATFLFEIAPAPAKIFQRLVELVDSSSPFVHSYPHPLAASALQRASFTPAFVSHQQIRDAHLLVACSKRAYREREALIASEYSAAVRAVLEEFDEVYAVRKGLIQAFDRLVLDASTGKAELHIDLCCALNGDQLITLAEKYRDRVNAFAATLGVAGFLEGPKNLFPKIAKFYNSSDGIVITLGHTTGTKSVKEERMRSRILDLRAELFHEQGIKAVKNTDAFSIKKGWKATGGHVPTIQIPGHYALIGLPNAVVPYAILENCMDQADFSGLVARLW